MCAPAGKSILGNGVAARVNEELYISIHLTRSALCLFVVVPVSPSALNAIIDVFPTPLLHYHMVNGKESIRNVRYILHWPAAVLEFHLSPCWIWISGNAQGSEINLVYNWWIASRGDNVKVWIARTSAIEEGCKKLVQFFWGFKLDRLIIDINFIQVTYLCCR